MQRLASRKSVATLVFLEKHVSIQDRLGHHMEIEGEKKKTMSEEEEEAIKKKKKQAKKREECKKFCCNKEEKTCMEKTGFDWFFIIFNLIMFWLILFGLMAGMFVIFTAIEGGDPTTGPGFEKKMPKLIDFSAVKRNINKGFGGKHKLEFPYKYGSMLYFPGLEPVTLGEWSGYRGKKKRAYESYQQFFRGVALEFKIHKNGSVRKKWANEYNELYWDYFKKRYKIPRTSMNQSCLVNPGKFRPYGKGWNKAACPWPNTNNITKKSFLTHHCKEVKKGKGRSKKGKGKTNTTQCYPYIYFTINKVYGWIPQKTRLNDTVTIYCEIDASEGRNQIGHLKKRDFEGKVEKKIEGVMDDFVQVDASRYPYLGQDGYISPMIRYKVVKLPKMKKQDVDMILKCRVDYEGYDDQMLKRAPFHTRINEERYWTHIRFRMSSSSWKTTPSVVSLAFGVVAAILTGAIASGVVVTIFTGAIASGLVAAIFTGVIASDLAASGINGAFLAGVTPLGVDSSLSSMLTCFF